MFTYEEAVAYIEEIPKFTTKNKLEHTRKCLDLLGSPDKKRKIIHVAGTNGKGSVCAFLSTMLEEGGYKCGLFTSRGGIAITRHGSDSLLRSMHSVS